MSDQIKVLSRDEVENLTESLVELVRHECRCGRTRFNFQHLPEVSRALDWIEMDIEKALREKLTVLIDEHEEPVPNKQVPAETVSSPGHRRWLRERQKQDALNPQPIEEPEPKWEPGMLAIFKDARTVVRLEREIEPGLPTWWVTDMQDGTEYE